MAVLQTTTKSARRAQGSAATRQNVGNFDNVARLHVRRHDYAFDLTDFWNLARELQGSCHWMSLGQPRKSVRSTREKVMPELRHAVFSLALMTIAAPSALAAPLVEAPVPTSAYITKNGYDWAWIFAVAADGSYGGLVPDFSFQAPLGWRLPTTAEMTLAPTATDFEFPGANVPLGTGDPVSNAYFAYPTPSLTGNAACAAAYFVDAAFEDHCDWANAPGSGPGNPDTEEHPWWGQPGAVNFSESLAIRSPIPEPGSLMLLSVALAGLGVIRRKRAR